MLVSRLDVGGLPDACVASHLCRERRRLWRWWPRPQLHHLPGLRPEHFQPVLRFRTVDGFRVGFPRMRKGVSLTQRQVVLPSVVRSKLNISYLQKCSLALDRRRNVIIPALNVMDSATPSTSPVPQNVRVGSGSRGTMSRKARLLGGVDPRCAFQIFQLLQNRPPRHVLVLLVNIRVSFLISGLTYAIGERLLLKWSPRSTERVDPGDHSNGEPSINGRYFLLHVGFV